MLAGDFTIGRGGLLTEGASQGQYLFFDQGLDQAEEAGELGVGFEGGLDELAPLVGVEVGVVPAGDLLGVAEGVGGGTSIARNGTTGQARAKVHRAVKAALKKKTVT